MDITMTLTDLQKENQTLKQDLVDYEHMIRELRRQVDDFENLFNTMPIMIWQKDTYNRHVRISKAAADLEGTKPEAIAGKTAEELYPPQQAAAFYKDDLEVIESGKPKLGIIEKHVTARTGEVTWLQTGKVPIRNRNGEVVGVVAFAVDITAQKQAEEALQKTHQELEKQHTQMARAQELFQSSLELLDDAVRRGAPREEIMHFISEARTRFKALEKK